jgi:hypothetical protein
MYTPKNVQTDAEPDQQRIRGRSEASQENSDGTSLKTRGTPLKTEPIRTNHTGTESQNRLGDTSTWGG